MGLRGVHVDVQVYRALKSVNPRIAVGGPYLTIEGTGSGRGGWATANPISVRNQAVLRYWLAHKAGADFLAFDRSLTDFHDPTTYSVADKMGLTHWSGDVCRQIAKLTDLPVWVMENRIGGPGAESVDAKAALSAAMLYHEVLSGASVSLQWGPEQKGPGAARTESLWTSTARPNGGAPNPTYFTYLMFNEAFPPGTSLYRTEISSPSVLALATKTATLLINPEATEADVRISRNSVTLAPYEVRLVGLDGASMMSSRNAVQ